jgi:hypothetical protein
VRHLRGQCPSCDWRTRVRNGRLSTTRADGADKGASANVRFWAGIRMSAHGAVQSFAAQAGMRDPGGRSEPPGGGGGGVVSRPPRTPAPRESHGESWSNSIAAPIDGRRSPTPCSAVAGVPAIAG